MLSTLQNALPMVPNVWLKCQFSLKHTKQAKGALNKIQNQMCAHSCHSLRFYMFECLLDGSMGSDWVLLLIPACVKGRKQLSVCYLAQCDEWRNK